MRFMAAFALSLGAASVQAQGLDPAVCDTTASIVADAQELRKSGTGAEDAVLELADKYKNLGEAYAGTVIPGLVNSYVYAQPESILDQDLAAFWKQTCLTSNG